MLLPSVLLFGNADDGIDWKDICMSFKVTRAIPSDAVEMAYTKLNAWKECYNEILPAPYIEKETEFEENYFTYQRKALQTGHMMFVIKFNNVMVGMFTLSNNSETDLADDFCQLDEMYFLPMYWNKGYGKRAFRYVKKISKIRKFSGIYLWTYARNTRAKYFFEICGFKPDGHTRMVEVGDGVEIEQIRMVKTDLINSQENSVEEA